MRHFGVQYISELAVCQAADHSLNPQFGLKVLTVI